MTLRCGKCMRCQGGILIVCFREAILVLKNNWSLKPQAACWWTYFMEWALWKQRSSLNETSHDVQKGEVWRHICGVCTNYITFGAIATLVLRGVYHIDCQFPHHGRKQGHSFCSIPSPVFLLLFPVTITWPLHWVWWSWSKSSCSRTPHSDPDVGDHLLPIYSLAF